MLVSCTSTPFLGTLLNGPHWIKDLCRSKDSDSNTTSRLLSVSLIVPILSLTAKCCHWPLYSEIPPFPGNQGAHLSRDVLHCHIGIQEVATKEFCEGLVIRSRHLLLDALVRKCFLSLWGVGRGAVRCASCV